MKATYISILLLITVAISTTQAQDVNFRALNSSKHLISAHARVDVATNYGFSYGYIFRNRLTPIVIGTEFTVPFGNEILDDWKWKTSIQAEVYKWRNFSVVFKPAFSWRRFETPLAIMQNFRADLSLTAGYSTTTWGLMAVAGFDKSIATRIKHGLLADYYPGIKDGWYGQGGGNFRFAARAHVTVNSWGAFLTAGKQFGQDFEDNPTIPFYTELSLQKRF